MTASETRLQVGVPAETFPGETRVAIVPGDLSMLQKCGLDVVIQSGAGKAAGHLDASYEKAGARVVATRDEVFSAADVITQVRAAAANPDHGDADLAKFRPGQTLIACCEPLWDPKPFQAVAERGVACFALELVPRITRAQSMDILSAMATIAGYKAVLLAADSFPRMFPMLMTAAGTLAPAKVLIIGAGVAGLQAISTARRLGGVVQSYDVRPAVKEQVESLGARFVELDLQTESSEQKGGYAAQMGDDFYRRQRELMKEVVAAHDIVITTAAIPGKKSPVLVTTEMVAAMAPGSVVVDIAAERGGNCELTRAAQTVVEHGVTIIGPCNLPATIPGHASQMYSRNVATFLKNLLNAGRIEFNMADEIIAETLVTRDGAIVHSRIRELLELPPLNPDSETATATTNDAPSNASESTSESTSAEKGEA